MSDAAPALETMLRRHRELFDAIPCAVAEVDSRSLFETARALTSSGVTDYEAYLTAHPDINNRTRDGLRFITANAEFLRMVGARHETDILGPIARFLPQTSHCAKFIAACAAGESRIQADMPLVRCDGTVMACHLETSLKLIDGRPHTSIVTLYDLTERVTAEERLAEAQAESMHAARVTMLGGLSVSIAHEIAQPLAVINLDALALKNWASRPAPDMAEIGELSTRLLAQTTRAIELLGNIRAMARRAPPEPAVLDLNGVTEASVRLVSHDLGRNKVALGQDLHPVALWVNADRVQVGQVLVNLLSNAVHALTSQPAPGRRIHVATRADGADAVLTVDDNGPGLDAAMGERVFERFYTTRAGGLGIGLSMARSIAVTHGGTLALGEAPVGWRTRFVLCLPRVAAV
ncbi:C4-dicarboxylate-specific signal transduction histidine kinase [Luteibacter sp. 621]|uniref:PAS domain-containing sensor histidine kinase n=1 Tax=Luteibacter sp. 621 TaxID=3373916 RepID=UPI003D1B09DB